MACLERCKCLQNFRNSASHLCQACIRRHFRKHSSLRAIPAHKYAARMLFTREKLLSFSSLILVLPLYLMPAMQRYMLGVLGRSMTVPKQRIEWPLRQFIKLSSHHRSAERGPTLLIDAIFVDCRTTSLRFVTVSTSVKLHTQYSEESTADMYNNVACTL